LEASTAGPRVFISYVSEEPDRATALAVCAAIEARGVRCWIAPRDVPPGRSYAQCIPAAIRRCSVVVLVMSGRTSRSKYVCNEVDLAVKVDRAILPLRIEPVEPEGDLEFLLSRVQWLDALAPPLEDHLDRLLEAVLAAVGAEGAPDPGPPAPEPRVQVTPAVPDLSPPPAGVLRAQKALALPGGLVRDGTGRIWSGKDGAEMVLVPGGEFVMGSDDADAHFFERERPVHRALLSAFLMDRHPVTVGQVLKSCAERRIPPPGGQQESERCPAVRVTWDEARDYAEWAGRRIPTEAEWEKAARGTDGQEYPWGKEEPTPSRANFEESGFGRPTPAGSFPAGASPYGCLDMAGNVWEWCADWYDTKYYAGSAWRDPKGPLSGSSRVLRGGAWNRASSYLRCATRRVQLPSWRDPTFGFRAARSLP